MGSAYDEWTDDRMHGREIKTDKLAETGGLKTYDPAWVQMIVAFCVGVAVGVGGAVVSWLLTAPPS